MIPLIPIIGLVGSVLDKLIPDADAARKAKDELSNLLTTQEFQTQLAQIQVNIEEAKSPNWFVAAWRPFIGWICGLTFAYNYLILPMGMWAIYSFGSAEMAKQVSSMPELDLAMMMPVLFGMLGLGGMRSFEKRTATEKNR